ncbi:MAG: DUF368 domain-containing protein [Myxococcota bacterium]
MTASSTSLADGVSMPIPLLVVRCLIGGLLMGLANLVPGISGGTMLLAAGVYPLFIASIANVTTLKLNLTSLVTLVVVGVAAVLAIVLFAGPVKDLVVNYRWAMYSLFIGLTLGGVPVVWQMARPATPAVWAGASAGFLLMAAIAVAQSGSHDSTGSSSGPVMMFLAGVAGASAMILPGISGGYLLLVLGVYVPILTAISSFKDALKAADVGAMMGPGLSVVLPVGLGVVIGVLVVSNALRFALARYEKATLGALLGFLVGAVVGLWPFQRGVAPELGSTFKGQVVTQAVLDKLEPSKFPTEYFSPSTGQVAAAVALVVLGFALTALIARFGRGGEPA